MAERVRIKELDDEAVALAPEEWERIAPGIYRFRLPNDEPVRRIITGRRNGKVGGFYSQKNCAHVVHESDGEEWCARVLDVHPAIRKFFGQPETLQIRIDASQPLRYTPDFIADVGGIDVRIEFKWYADLHPPEPQDRSDERGWRRWEEAAEMRRRLRTVRDAYRSAGLLWLPVTDVDLVRMADRETLDEIVRNGGRPIDADDRARLVRLLRRRRGEGVTLAECEGALRKSEFPRGDVLARVQERLIRINLHEPITPESLVHLVEG